MLFLALHNIKQTWQQTHIRWKLTYKDSLYANIWDEY